MTKTTTNPKEIAVTVIGPNGVQQLEIHAHGCADLGKAKYRRSERTDETITSLQQVTESWYADQIAECYDETDPYSTWEAYAAEFKIFPCVGHLPRTDAANAPKAPTTVKLTTAEKQIIRKQMAALLRDAEFGPAEMAYVEAHWLKYIDPDLDAARRSK